ncbi:IclR family transcriptional regulator C-terminal domain-containing protein [Streptomyces sp. NPDC052079]|uniref:IclR family transcriptional regulator domain-containing protein n=1 Tax=Streptomyces sp. NPDC052079 TaxID=3155526 RepID=UPI003429C228
MYPAHMSPRCARTASPARSSGSRSTRSPSRRYCAVAGAGEQGYATTLEELEPGPAAVAAPVRSHDGTVVAAISVSGPVHRLTADRLPRLGSRTAKAAADLSRRMGCGF